MTRRKCAQSFTSFLVEFYHVLGLLIAHQSLFELDRAGMVKYNVQNTQFHKCLEFYAETPQVYGK